VTSVQNGALLSTCVGGAGALVMAAAGLSSGNASLVFAAAIMLLLLAASGAIGGWVYDATENLRDRGVSGVAASWFFALGATVVMFAIPSLLMLPKLALEGSAAYRVAFLTGQAVAWALLAAVLLFAIIAANAHARTGIAPDAELLTPVSIWGTAFLLFFSTTAFLGESSEIPLSEDRATAERVLRYAEDEARLFPRSFPAQFALGMAYLELDRDTEAVAPLAAAVQLEADHAWARNVLGWTLNSLDRHEEALPHLQAAVQLSPAYELAIRNLAFANFSLERWEPAERAYRKSLGYEPENAEVRRAFAWVLHRRGKDSLALVEILRTLKLDSRDAWAHDFASRLLIERERWVEAQAHYDTAVMLRKAEASGSGGSTPR